MTTPKLNLRERGSEDVSTSTKDGNFGGVIIGWGEGRDNAEAESPVVTPRNASPGRGRTPSPKRNPAPAPPNPLRCPSPAHKAVSTSDVLPTDQQGWLTDQLRGRKVWCAVADMLFCVFEKPDSKVSKQVSDGILFFFFYLLLTFLIPFLLNT